MLRPLLALALLTLATGCSHLRPAPTEEAAAVETRQDLVSAFLERGWNVSPVAFRPTEGLVGRGTEYRVSGRTVLIYDYASAEEAASSGLEDARRISWLAAGQSAQVYLREALVVVTYERLGRTAFDVRLARLLSGPSVRRGAA